MAGAKKEKLAKARVTTYLDRDVLMWLKVRALEQRLGYQTLLNRMLRDAIELEGARSAEAGSEVKHASRTEVQELALAIKRVERQMKSMRVAAAGDVAARSRSGRKRKAPSRRGAKSRTRGSR